MVIRHVVLISGVLMGGGGSMYINIIYTRRNIIQKRFIL